MAGWIATDRLLIGAVWGLAVGCAVSPQLAENPHPERYEVCDDPDGLRVLDAANALIAALRYSEAVPLLREVLDHCPEHVPTHVLYQDTCQRVAGEALTEMQGYYDALRGPPPDSVARYMRTRLQEHDSTRLTALNEIIEADPGFFYAYFSKARLQRDNNQIGFAVQSFLDALEVNPNMLQAHLELGEMLVELRRLTEARPHYANYVRGNPADPAARRAYMRLLLYDLEDFDEAREHIAVLMEVDPDDPELMMDRAALSWRSGRLAEAETLYQKVLDRDPTTAIALLNLGNLYFDGMVRTDEDKRRYWPLARRAYENYLTLSRAEGAMDLLDFHLAIPFRLKVINSFLEDGKGP